MNKPSLCLYGLLWKAVFMFSCVTCTVSSMSAQLIDKPNIVVIMADDLGYGDVGCFGNDTIKTPHIDRIAQEGAIMTHFIAAAAMCTPSRSAMLTGRYAVRSGMAGSDLVPVNLFTASRAGLPPNEITFAELAKASGYKTGVIGKWHLGWNKHYYGDKVYHPHNQGFDYFFGIPVTNFREFGENEVPSIIKGNPHIRPIAYTLLIGGPLLVYMLFHKKMIGKCSSCLLLLLFLLSFIPYLFMINFKLFNSMLIRNDEIVEQPIRFKNLTQRLVKESKEFLEARHKDGEPFLLYVSWLQVHTVLHTSPDFKGHSVHGSYGDNVEEMDWGTGQILEALETFGMKQNTFVLFTSDHGAHVEEKGNRGDRQGGYNGIFRGSKMQGGMEGGIRIPTTAMWPGHIQPGLVIDEPLTNMDIFATIADLVQQPLPDDRIIDGRSLYPILTGQTSHSPHQFLFHYCTDVIHAVRLRPRESSSVWKVRYATPNWNPGTEECDFLCRCVKHHVMHDPLVFDIRADPREEKPLSVDEPLYKSIVSLAEKAIKEHKDSIEPVDEQLTVLNTIPMLHQQPCCNFPFCDCEKP